jgi:gas vesicle protein
MLSSSSKFLFSLGIHSARNSNANVYSALISRSLGGLLAVGAAVGLMMTDEGQQLSEDVKKDLQTLAKKLKKRLHTLEDITEDSFNDLVSTIVDEFAKQNQIAEDVKATLTKSLKAMWSEMEAVALAEKEETAA